MRMGDWRRGTKCARYVTLQDTHCLRSKFLFLLFTTKTTRPSLLRPSLRRRRMSLRHDRGRDRDRAGGEVLPVPRSLDVHEVVQRREDGVFVEGFACFTHKSVVATVTNLHLEHWNELNPVSGLRGNELSVE